MSLVTRQINPDVIGVGKWAPTPYTLSVGAQYNVDRDTECRCYSAL
ncbi:hypothetical protein BDFB_005417 [Asbolus verrucosus]|uniref:Uncharacterized protein n=1 Tax=Asbolus verrucosus TaxID=1661398 RepID=A0A482VC67_ASBVE|nr:hypothetical protein BDFB_005417 [Asbolus verrucosus]